MHIEVGGFPDNLGEYIFPICYIKHEGRIVMRDKRESFQAGMMKCICPTLY